MKTKIIVASTLMTGLLAFASISNAGPGFGHKGGYEKYSQMSEAEKAEHMEKRLNRMAKKLNLSDEQKTQMRALKQNRRNEIKPLRNEQRAIRKEIRQLDTNASDYQAKLADAANRQAEITRQMIIAKGNQRQQMATILTPEQLAKKKEMRAKRKAKYHKKMHRKHHRKQRQES